MTGTNQSREFVTKKRRIDNALEDDSETIDTVWQHFRAYLDSCDADGQGDIDELVEIIELLGPVDPIQTLDSLAGRSSFVPVLASVSHGYIADHHLSDFIASKDTELVSTIQYHFTECLRLFPFHASMWSILANACRMQVLQSTTIDTHVMAGAYQKACECAIAVRQYALNVLESDPEDPVVLEWVEVLLLNQVVGVEWCDDENDDDEVNEVDEKDPEESNGDPEERGKWSASEVENTARFMAAMLLSTLGDHDTALQHLKHFSVTHRLHPNVWDEHTNPVENSNTSEVMVWGEKNDGVLPDRLYSRLCDVFSPEAAYWKESDYNNRGYYSYFMNIDASRQPTNLIEDVILNHLLPLAQKSTKADSRICGAEWWVHTRPVQANLGHNLHFDTDEALLSQEKDVTHPVVSSVLYLTGGRTGGGATIVLDQTPQSTEVAPFVWKNFPENNTLLVFPGNRLHGVLPCPGQAAAGNNNKKVRKNKVEISDLFVTSSQGKPPIKDHQHHRLTFMVGFWTRRVPDRMERRGLYTPCGELPPATKEHTWVQQISSEYGDHTDLCDPKSSIDLSGVATVTPAWQSLVLSKEHELLEVPPKGIDHRFFVKDAPRCFWNSLFETEDSEGNAD